MVFVFQINCYYSVLLFNQYSTKNNLLVFYCIVGCVKSFTLKHDTLYGFVLMGSLRNILDYLQCRIIRISGGSVFVVFVALRYEFTSSTKRKKQKSFCFNETENECIYKISSPRIHIKPESTKTQQQTYFEPWFFKYYCLRIFISMLTNIKIEYCNEIFT